MATIGRWGITRDEMGKLANLYAWPWYWRYPAMILGMACLVAFLAYQEGNKPATHQTFILILCGVAALWLISITYELAGLALVICLFWGGSKLVGAFLPDSWKPVTRDEVEEIRAQADSAYELAEQANAAIADGADSSTTMGDEIQEAKAEAAEANAAAAEAQAQVAELESRLDAICYKAPALCL
jgi:hypothetical protein